MSRSNRITRHRDTNIASNPRKGYRAQVAALPVRGTVGKYEVLLITSRETRRWIIPKGWPMKGRRDHEAAAQEAFEEAGVRGRIHKHPMGAYVYDKQIDGNAVSVRVMVYLLKVDHEADGWREKDQRERRWMETSEAANLIDEPALIEIIRRLDVASDFG